MLGRCEEKGIPQLFTGSVNADAGSVVSEFAQEITGYLTTMSFQEVSAYSIQCEMLRRELDAVVALHRGAPPMLAIKHLVVELEEMARWGWAMSGRTQDVAEQMVGHLRGAPQGVDVGRWPMAVLDANGDESDAGPPVIWTWSVALLGLNVQAPLAGPAAHDAFEARETAGEGSADWHLHHGQLSQMVIEHYEALSACTARLTDAFQQIELAAASAKQDRVPSSVHIAALCESVSRMRQITEEDTSSYRAEREL